MALIKNQVFKWAVYICVHLKLWNTIYPRRDEKSMSSRHLPVLCDLHAVVSLGPQSLLRSNDRPQYMVALKSDPDQ